jgi:hypothetical protein
LTGDKNQVDDIKLEKLGVDYLDSVMKNSKYYTGLEFTHSECRSGVVKEFLDREKMFIKK